MNTELPVVAKRVPDGVRMTASKMKWLTDLSQHGDIWSLESVTTEYE
jgi:hypothetical protein